MISADEIAILAAAFSTGSAALSVFEARRAVRVSTSTGTTELLVSLDQVLIDHLQVRPYFEEGKDCLPEDPLYQEAQAVAVLFLNVLEGIAGESAVWGGVTSDPGVVM
ncbi:MAG: hypothetical protein ACLPVY_12590 [Acidimicrobiia bacterium]